MKTKLILALICLATVVHAARESVNIDFDWKMKAGEVVGLEQPQLDDAGWRLLDLPHDWSIEQPYGADNPDGGRCGYLPGGVVCYRKAFEVPANWTGKKVSVNFDSVYMDSTVWLNGVKLGSRPYGYITFAYDLTPYLKPGKNVLAVRVDNTQQPSGRWYTGTGIFGHVNLLITEPVHLKRGSIFFQTVEADSKQAVVHVDAEVAGDPDAEVLNQLWIERNGLFFKGLKKVAETRGAQMTVKAPKLWSVDTPNLYTLRTIVKSGGAVVDQVDTPVGIRTLRFDNKTGFYLNDVPMKLKGVCEHHDGGPVGGAFPEKILRERIALLKAMGCNAIRTSHNPRTADFYKICDELGMMVMDEVFDGWHKKAEADYGGRFFDEWWKTDVEEWIRANRNYPCIVLYSIGNETGQTDEHDISGYIKKFDTTRPTTGGTVFDGVDIQGYNGPGGTPGSMQKFHEDYPNEICVRTEVPHTLQTRGFYRVRTWWRDLKKERNEIPEYGKEQIFFDGNARYSSSYDNCGVRISARTSWRETRDMPWIIGEFRWTGFDYIGEASFGGGVWPARIWNFGIIDLAGFPKDHFWFYQSQWSKEPMVHLLPHWTHRFLKPGTIVPVVGYSNCDEVELFLNGQSLGKKTEDPEWLEFVWQVPYEAGELKAVGYNNGKPVAEKIWVTAGAPVALKLETNNKALIADRLDTATITVQALDADGNNVPWSMNRVDFKIEGPVKNLGFENGDPVDVTSHRVNHRKLFYGCARGFFQAQDGAEPVQITAASILGDPLFEKSEQVAIDMKTVMLRGRLGPSNIEIRYSLDGSEPTVDYTGPFVLTDSATVKAVVLRNGEELIRLEQAFVKGIKPLISDPRWAASFSDSSWGASANGYKGPFDPELAGRWKSGKTVYDFRANGEVFEKGEKVAFWAYDYPNDAFEAGHDDAGIGQINWVSSLENIAELKMENQDNKTLLITEPSGSKKTWKRVE